MGRDSRSNVPEHGVATLQEIAQFELGAHCGPVDSEGGFKLQLGPERATK